MTVSEWGEGYVVPGGRRELEMFPHPTLYKAVHYSLYTLHVGITRTKGEGTSSNPEELPPVPVLELWCDPFRKSTCGDTKIQTLSTRTRQVSVRSLTSGLQRLPIRSNHHGCVTSLTSRPHAYRLHFSNNCSVLYTYSWLQYFVVAYTKTTKFVIF